MPVSCAHRRERALERRAQVRDRLRHLGAAALALLVGQRLLRAQHERDAEQPLHHALTAIEANLTSSEIAEFKGRLTKCWAPPEDATGMQGLSLSIRILLDRAGDCGPNRS